MYLILSLMWIVTGCVAGVGACGGSPAAPRAIALAAACRTADAAMPGLAQHVMITVRRNDTAAGRANRRGGIWASTREHRRGSIDEGASTTGIGDEASAGAYASASRARVARWRFRGTKSCRFIFEHETRREWECEYKEGLARRRRRIERGIREFLSDALGGRRCGREGGPGVGTAQ